MTQDNHMGEETQQFFEDCYTKYYGKLKAIAQRVAEDRAHKVDISSLAIDTLLKAALHRHELRHSGSLNAWVTSILVNQVMTKLRLAEVKTKPLPPEEVLRVASCSEEHERLEKEEEKLYLLSLLEKLPTSYRAVICLRLDNYPDAQVAELLGISQEAVRQRRSRAMAQLKALAKTHPPHGDPDT